MTTPKPSESILWMMMIGLMIIFLVFTGLLVIFGDEIVEIRWTIPDDVQPYLNNLETWKTGQGDEFTGVATSLLFGVSCIPVIIDLIFKRIIRINGLGERGKKLLRDINCFQKKYLMPFHAIISIPALGLGMLHLALSSCVANPLPELGLIFIGILVATGLLFKWNIVPNSFRKILFKFHSNLLVSCVILVILYTGHAVMDAD